MLQFKRTRIKVRQVVWPAIFLIVVATVILSVWTAMGEFGWEREQINDLTGETLGSCRGSRTSAFLVPVGIICVIPTMLTGIMAWKTSDVDDLYSESKWIFCLILVQLQVCHIRVESLCSSFPFFSSIPTASVGYLCRSSSDCHTARCVA